MGVVLGRAGVLVAVGVITAQGAAAALARDDVVRSRRGHVCPAPPPVAARRRRRLPICHSYVAKVKNLLLGLPPTDDEVQAVQADPAALKTLISTLMQLPQYDQN